MHERVVSTCDCPFGQHHDGGGRKARWTRNAVVGLAAGAVALSAVVSSAPDASAKDKNKWVQIVAHRGGQDVGPEHTMKTLRKAIRLGSDAVEIDVRFTKDHVPVLMHDASLDRTTDCDGRVSRLTLRELRRCDAGDGDEERRIPTLRQALRMISKTDAGVYVHVKESTHPEHYGQVVRELNRFHLNDGWRAVTIADRPEVLRALRHAGSKRLGLVFNTRDGWDARYPVLVAYNTELRKDLISRAHKRGQVVLAVQDHGLSLRELTRGRSNVDGFLANRLRDTLRKLDR